MGSQRRQWAASGAAMLKKLKSSWNEVSWDDDAILQEAERQNLVSRDPSNMKEQWKCWMADYAASGAVRWRDHAVVLNPRTELVVDHLGNNVFEQKKTSGNVVICPQTSTTCMAEADG